MKPNARFCMLFLALLIISQHSLAANELVNVDEQGVAIHGYDPVAYFAENKPVKGQPSLHYQWSNATWLFANAANKQAFIDAPTKYAPQFGGFCAYAASSGHFADTDPAAWSIVNKKLYLNYNTSVRGIWNSNRADFIRKAEELWPTMRP
jgi:YHS domain-containing protein